MQTAIVTILKDGTTAYAFPAGATHLINLFCETTPKKFTDVIIDSSYVEYDTWATGRIHAVKITSDGCDTMYVKSSVRDLLNIQECCSTRLTYAITLACDAIPPITVYDVLGNSLGSASTSAEYVTLWNSSTNNQAIGTLFETPTPFLFALQYIAGNFKPDALQCAGSVAPPTVEACPTVTVGNVTQTEIDYTWTGTQGNSYFYQLFNGSTLVTSGTTTNLHVELTSLTANTSYSFRVSPGTSANSSCPLTTHSTSPVPAPTARIEWGYSVTEPTDLVNASYPDGENLNIVNGQVSLSVSDAPANTWFIARYPSPNPTFTTWYNTNLNNGTIPDQVFLDITTIGSYMYLKSRTAVTFDTTQPLVLGTTSA